MYDRDNDLTSGNCALVTKGGWLYRACKHSQLNGLYHHDTTPISYLAVLRESFIGAPCKFFAEMKLKASQRLIDNIILCHVVAETQLYIYTTMLAYFSLIHQIS